MELPKNVTQIGESDRNCKIYVEDYVISYIKQVNQLAINKEMAVALYGVRKTEGSVMYLFIYGACKLDFLHRDTRHLSQAQCQEIEKLRRKYFSQYEFQGYRLLNGEMVEGFHIQEQGICRYISGFAQFYEKNDNMLAYMLDTRMEEASPEVVDQEKYEVVKRKQEERRTQYTEEGEVSSESHRNRAGYGRPFELTKEKEIAERSQKTKAQNAPSRGLNTMRLSTVAVFAILCIAGYATLGQGRSLEELQNAAKRAVSSLTEQKLPDAQEVSTQDVVVQNVQNSTLIAEDKLAEALQAENAESQLQETTSTQPVLTQDVSGQEIVAPTQEETPVSESVSVVESVVGGQQETTMEVAQNIEQQQTITTPLAEVTQAPDAALATDNTQEVLATDNAQEAVATEEVTAQPIAYIIQQGDTLIGISVRNYGTDTMVSEICSLNQISNPDDIKVGQKILLP